MSNYPSALNKKYYDDLTDYHRGIVHGIVSAHVCLFVLGMTFKLYGTYKGMRRPQYPLVHNSIRMSRDSEVLLPLWRRPFPRKWVKIDQKGLVDVTPLGLEANKGRVVEVPAMLKEMNVNVTPNWMKIDQKGPVDVTPLGLEAKEGRTVEVPAMLKEMSMKMQVAVQVRCTFGEFGGLD